jgi:Tissue inhibitor of metalloproteinase
MTAPLPATCPGTVFLSAVALALLVSSAHACSCLSQSLEIQYHDASITRVVRAVVLREWPTAVADQAANKYYQISVKQAFKGCVEPSPVRISTASNSAACGVDLNVGSEYLLLLSGGGNDLATHLCLANALFKDVSASDRAFLSSRRVC